jgi:hypothetical protein
MLLNARDLELETWLGAEEAAAPKEVLAAAQHAVNQAVAQRIQRSKEQFVAAHKAAGKRAEVIAATADIRPWQYYREFSSHIDGYEQQKCPACNATGILGGVLWSEEVSEEQDEDDPSVEYVDKTYVSEEFRCFTCGFAARGRREALAAGMPEEFYETDTRERKFEPEYDNE